MSAGTFALHIYAISCIYDVNKHFYRFSHHTSNNVPTDVYIYRM